MSLISRFDPWRSPLCTCPPKLTFNPYTGCDHACVYCYASSYIPEFSNCRPKKDLLSRLEKEASKLKGETVSISNSSDPYPNADAETGLMRNCLKILTEHNCKIQTITKSTIVTRDTDLLGRVPSMVAITITTDDDSTAKLIEPYAPSPSDRLKAAETLIKKGIATSVRIDPIIPLVNENQEPLIRTLASIGVRHITTSTFKVRTDNWQRFSMVMPEAAEKLKPLYFEKGQRISGYLYLPRDMRLQLMKTVATLAAKHGIKFGTCREDLGYLNTAACDGSWLLPKTGSR